MTAVKLLVEHNYGKKSIRRLSIEPTSRSPIVLGSGRETNLRLVGEGVSPIHAALEKRGDAWYLVDMGSTTGTWVSGESIVERKITGPIHVTIGPHNLSLCPAKPKRDIFAKDSLESKNLGHHQIVIKRGSKILETHLLPKEESFSYYDGKTEHVLPAPKTGAWTNVVLGKNQVCQRLVPVQALVDSDSLTWVGPEVRKPLMLVFAGLCMILAAIILWPSAPQEKLALNNPAEVKNIYEQMVFDAKLVKKKRDEAGKITAKKFKPAEGSVAGPAGGLKGNGVPGGGGQPNGEKGAGGVASAAPGTGQGVRLITNIRASGLNQLIGKIAKRASKNVMQIGAGGAAVTPDTVASGSAVAAIAGTQTAANASVDRVATVAGVNFGAQNNGGFRLGGVNTNGQGGGGTARGQGLQTGVVGSGTGAGTGTGYGNGVGTGMGLDDEAEVSGGGLDKEVIAEIIKRDIGQIRYCYERQLSSSPDIYGKVVVKFGIGADGVVEFPKVGTSTLNNAMVEGCILRRAAKWKFPNPKGGMQVLVTYPFLFKSLK